MRAIESPARVMMTVNTERMKVLQMDTLKTMRAMRSVFRGLLWQGGRFCLYEDYRLQYQKVLLRRLQRPL
jgi:hypothetical protein